MVELLCEANEATRSHPVEEEGGQSTITRRVRQPSGHEDEVVETGNAPGRHDAFKIVGRAAAKTEQNRIWIPKIGWFSFRGRRPFRGRVTSYVVSRVADRWDVSLQCEREVEEPQARQEAWIGIDVGVAQYATLSDGTMYASMHPLKRQLLKLKRLQRKLARKKDKKSHRRYKLKLRIARLHHHIANIRQDHAHQVSTEIVRKHGRIRVENLSLVNMMKSAKGTIENPGSRVAQKAGLNRSLSDQGLGQFVQYLEYKLSWSGGMLERVDPRYTSQRCFVCGHTSKDNRMTQAKFCCVSCGHTAHADLNAAQNIAAGSVAEQGSRNLPKRTRRRRFVHPALEPCTTRLVN